MGIDEAGTLSPLNALRRELIDPTIAAKDIITLDDDVANIDADLVPDGICVGEADMYELGP